MGYRDEASQMLDFVVHIPPEDTVDYRLDAVLAVRIFIVIALCYHVFRYVTRE